MCVVCVFARFVELVFAAYVVKAVVGNDDEAQSEEEEADEDHYGGGGGDAIAPAGACPLQRARVCVSVCVV